MLNSVTPFFIVDDLAATLAFYQSRLGFGVLYKGGDANGDFWAMVGRDHVSLMFKAIAPGVHPLPNRARHEWARWDAYISNLSDGLRAFEVADNNCYVLCSGCPIEK